MQRKIIGTFTAVVSLVIVLVLMGIFGWQRLKQKQEDELFLSKTEKNDITRYEWISMLTEHYGISEYNENAPFFEDVSADNAHFAEIQSAVEWKILKTGTAFEGDQYASGRFTALTAMRIVGQTKLKMYAKTRKELDDKDLIEIAIEEGLITEEGLTEGVSRAQSEEMLEHLHELYYGKFSPNDYLDISYQKDVIILDPADVSIVAEQENTIIVAEDIVKNLQEDAIIIYEDNIGVKQAGKITHIQVDGTIELESVRPEQFLESFTASGQQRVDFDDMVTYCQLSDDQLEAHETTTENMRYEKGNEAEIITANASIEGFLLALESVEDEDDGSKYLQVKLTNGNGLSYVFQAEDAKRLELEDDEDIKVELSVNRLEVLGQTDYQLLQGWDYAEVALNIDTVMSGVVSISEEEKMLLAEIPLPMAGGAMKINVQIYLVIGMDGSIELRAEMPLQGEVRYEKGVGFRKASFDINVEEPSLQTDCRLDLVLRGEPVLSVFGCDVIDAEADVGMCTEASTAIRATGQQCMDISGGYPTVTLAVLGDEDAETLLSEFVSGKSWDIITKDQTLFELYMHFEQLNDGTRQFVDECTYREAEKAEITDLVLNGDFSEFAGSYKATESANDGYGGGQPLANLELHEDGSVSGGGSWYSPEPYSSQKPKSITKNDDGSYLCVITDEGDVIENRYFIYPEGIIEERVSNEEYLVDTVYIRFVRVDGGVLDITYYKDTEMNESKSANRMDTYTTKHGSTPTFAVDYPKTWFVDKEEMNQDYEWDVIKNERGVEINYYSCKTGLGSQYYGGNFEMQYAHITKVADASFIPTTYGGSDYSSLGTCVVAKIKVYAYEDGLSEEGQVEYDGPTYYAVVPESYLGEEGFCGTGYWSVCSFEYVRPMVILATSSNGVFTLDEEADVIKILSSFRVN